jgi:hypothetical protein
MRRRQFIALLAARWGFAAMVTVAIAVGVVVAATVAPPVDVPTFALQAGAVYRVEVGAAVFFGLYVATMALALALHNRGFTEIGSGGIKAQGLAGLPEGEFVTDLLADLAEDIGDLETRIEESEHVR